MHIRRAWNTWGKRKENNIGSSSSNIGCNKNGCNAAPACFADKRKGSLSCTTRSIYRYFSDLYSPPQLQTLLVADLAEKDNITISTAAAEIYFHFRTRRVCLCVCMLCIYIDVYTILESTRSFAPCAPFIYQFARQFALLLIHTLPPIKVCHLWYSNRQIIVKAKCWCVDSNGDHTVESVAFCASAIANSLLSKLSALRNFRLCDIQVYKHLFACAPCI